MRDTSYTIDTNNLCPERLHCLETQYLLYIHNNISVILNSKYFLFCRIFINEIFEKYEYVLKTKEREESREKLNKPKKSGSTRRNLFKDTEPKSMAGSKASSIRSDNKSERPSTSKPKESSINKSNQPENNIKNETSVYQEL